MYDLKTEILQICEAFNLGSYKGMKTYKSNCKGFILSVFTTSQGTFKHYYKIRS